MKLLKKKKGNLHRIEQISFSLTTLERLQKKEMKFIPSIFSIFCPIKNTTIEERKN